MKELAFVGEAIIKLTPAQIDLMASQPNATALHGMIGAIVKRTLKNGDPIAFDKLMDRLIGKVKDTVEVQGLDNGPRIIVTIPSNGREAPVIPSEEISQEQNTLLEHKPDDAPQHKEE
jgi:hypothetical protein